MKVQPYGPNNSSVHHFERSLCTYFLYSYIVKLFCWRIVYHKQDVMLFVSFLDIVFFVFPYLIITDLLTFTRIWTVISKGKIIYKLKYPK